MNIQRREISTALVLLGATLSIAVPAQTPLPKSSPKLTILWLSSMAVSPASATAGTNSPGR